MESKNIKVIDEHNIDRDANIICSVDIDGSDYVVYSIERDEGNDNVFISKLIKNTDGTSNMMNIDDKDEKERLNNVIKELITYSINSDDDKTNGSVTLSDGKVVKISSVLFNKEQHISVNKTYITTVKKSVTKASENFYKTDEVKPAEPVVESIFDATDEVKEEPAVAPQPEVESEVAVEAPIPQPVVEENTVPPLEVPDIDLTPQMPEIEEPVVEESAPVLSTPVLDIPAEPEETTVPSEVVPENVEAPTEPVLEMAPPVVSVVPPVQPTEPVVAPQPEVPEVPVTPEVPTAPEAPVENKLTFDASKETNLNKALGEASTEAAVPVENVSYIREFGMDEPTAPEAPETPVAPAGNGFANNKFFVVVAIVFFVAACVFLGYEAFKYFSIVGK